MQPASAGAGAQLNYLSAVSAALGLPDPVEEYFGPIAGRWRDLHGEAERWRRAARAVEELAAGVTSPLGRLDAAWHGSVSDSFLDHMAGVGRAAPGASDAMAAMAGVLDRTAEAMHRLVTDTVDMLAGGADRVSLAMLLPFGGEARAGGQVAELHRHGRRLLESAHQLLEAFAQVCASLDGSQPFAAVRAAAAFPERNWSFAGQPPAVAGPGMPAAEPDASGMAGAVTASGSAFHGGAGGSAGASGGGLGASAAGDGDAGRAAAADPPEPAMRTFAAEPGGGPAGSGGAGAAGQAAGTVTGAAGQRGGSAGPGFAMPFMPMGAGMAAQGGGSERRSKSGLTADPVEIFGEPTKTAPPVIGED